LLLGPIEYVLNSSIQSSTGYSPFELDYGRKIIYPTDLLLDNSNDGKKYNIPEFIESHKMIIRDAIESLRSAIRNQEIYSNLKRRDHQFSVGDRVFLKMKNYTTGEHRFRPKKKLSAKWSGPFKIIEIISHTAVKLELPPNWQIHNVIHVSNLWPAVIDEDNEFGREEIQPPPELINGFEEFEVDRIIDKRYNRQKRRNEYLVIWKGHPDDVSWEPLHHLTNAKDELLRFESGTLNPNLQPLQDSNIIINESVPSEPGASDLNHNSNTKTTRSGRIIKRNAKYND
jgi:hypothetical protein